MHGEMAEVRTHAEYVELIESHRDDTGLPVIADFYSPGCGPCRAIAPVLKKMAAEMKGRAGARPHCRVERNKGT